MKDRYIETHKTWNKIAQLYENHFMDLELYHDTYKKFCDFLSRTDASILEIGCGPGNITQFLLEFNANLKILAIDISVNMIKLTKKNNPGIDVKTLDCRNIDVLKNITKATDLKVDFGGGVKSTRDIEQAFEAGASMITGGSIAVKEPKVFEQWIDQYGPDKIILGADVKGRNIAVGGWMDTSEQDIIQFIDHYTKRSIKFVICTDISKDGVLKGSALELYKELLNAFPGINLIASGGVGSLKDVEDLAESGVWGVIVGKAIYEGRVDLDDLIKFQK